MALHPETALQISMVRFLRTALPHGWKAVAVPNGGKRGPFEAKLLKDMGATAGFPDLIVFGQQDNQPVTYMIEVKVPAKYSQLSDPQKECRDWLLDMGFPHTVVRSIDELYDIGVKWGWPWRFKMNTRRTADDVADHNPARPRAGAKGAANPRRAGPLGRRRPTRNDMPRVSVLVEDEQVDIRGSNERSVQQGTGAVDEPKSSPLST